MEWVERDGTPQRVVRGERQRPARPEQERGRERGACVVRVGEDTDSALRDHLHAGGGREHLGHTDTGEILFVVKYGSFCIYRFAVFVSHLLY